MSSSDDASASGAPTPTPPSAAAVVVGDEQPTTTPTTPTTSAPTSAPTAPASVSAPAGLELHDPHTAPGDSAGPFAFYERSDDAAAAGGARFRLHYRRFGAVDAEHRVVFVQGLLASARAWENQIDFLLATPERRARFEVVLVDNRGVGSSDVPPGPYSTDAMAADVLALIDDALPHWRTFHIVGMSMGGMIAQKLAVLADTRVRSLALLCTRGNMSWWGRLPSFAALGRMALQAAAVAPDDYRGQAELTIPSLYSADFLDGDGVRARLVERFARRRAEQPLNAATMPAQLAAVRNHELSDAELRTLRAMRKRGTPIGALTGTADDLIHHSSSERMRDDFGATVTLLDGVGHGLIDEAPDAVNRWLEQLWLGTEEAK